MIHAIDLRGKSLPDMDASEAEESIREGMAAWKVEGRNLICVTEDDLGDSCEFCGSAEDLVVIGKAESKTRIFVYDFGTVCRGCRQSHGWMTKRQYDAHIVSQMQMLAEFYIRYPGSQMALCRIWQGKMRDIIGYAPINEIAEMVMRLDGKIVIARSRNVHLFEYGKAPTKRAEKPDWFWDWFFEHHKGRCFFCGRKIPRRKVSLDHLVPLTRLGHDEAQNLVLSCSWCNKDKGTMMAEEYLGYLERRRLVGRRLGIDVSILGSFCEEYQRSVSHRASCEENPLAPIMLGCEVKDERCSREMFEEKYCSCCLNDRCGKMRERIDDDGHRQVARGSPVPDDGPAGDMAGWVESDGGDPEASVGRSSGSGAEDHASGSARCERLERDRKQRRRKKRRLKGNRH